MLRCVESKPQALVLRVWSTYAVGREDLCYPKTGMPRIRIVCISSFHTVMATGNLPCTSLGVRSKQQHDAKLLGRISCLGETDLRLKNDSIFPSQFPHS